MKRGILEIADVIAVNKADGEHQAASERAAREPSAALRLLRGQEDAWHVPVLTCSALHNTGVERVWGQLVRHRGHQLGMGVGVDQSVGARSDDRRGEAREK
jgi:LAO/AO transport system kinase